MQQLVVPGGRTNDDFVLQGAVPRAVARAAHAPAADALRHVGRRGRSGGAGRARTGQAGAAEEVMIVSGRSASVHSIVKSFVCTGCDITPFPNNPNTTNKPRHRTLPLGFRFGARFCAGFLCRSLAFGRRCRCFGRLSGWAFRCHNLQSAMAGNRPSDRRLRVTAQHHASVQKQGVHTTIHTIGVHVSFLLLPIA